MSYTDILLGKKLSGGGGGGGMRTCQFTINVPHAYYDQDYWVNVPVIMDSAIMPIFMIGGTSPQRTVTVPVPLSEEGYAVFYDAPEAGWKYIEVSGDIQFVSGMNAYIISGDCSATITFTDM